jgi:DnaK suppressor protein
MNEPDDGRYKAALLREKEGLLEMKAVSEEAARPVQLDQSSVGRLSRMDAMQMQHMALETKRRREWRLQRIDGALRRIKDEQFGICFACGETIEKARLDFDPTTTRCVNCVEED